MTASFSTAHETTKYISLVLSSDLYHNIIGELSLASMYFKVLIIKNPPTYITIPVNF